MGDYQQQLFTKPMAHLYLLLIFHLFAAFSIPSEARSPENHCHALLQLKGRLNFSIHLQSWTNATDSDCCDGWHGVKCDPLSAGVTSLDLNNLYLRGMVVPDALFTLTNLTTLNLAFNNLNFSEVISSQRAFEKLDKLKVLNLSYSGFLGQIPMGISTLTNLVSLDFSTMYLSSKIFLKHPNLELLIRDMKDLRKLYLDGVDLSSDGINWGRALSESHPRLAELSLRTCNLSGSGGASIAKLRSLTVLRLDGNNLASVDTGFLGKLSSLQTLGLSRCSLNGSIPEGIFRLSNLTSLDMSDNPLLGGSLPEMDPGLLTSLESLKLSNCNLSGHIPSSIGKLSGLTELDLSDNNLSGKLPPELESRSSISLISLANNNLTGSIPSNYGNFSSLTVLDVQNNSLIGQIPSSLFSLPSLKTLRLQQNKLSGNLEELFHAEAPLETVDLSNNNLQGSIPDAIFNLWRLKILSLARNKFSGKVQLNQLVGLRNLSSLDLSYNMLTVMGSESSDDASRKNSASPNISTLKLASCNLTRFPVFLKDQAKLQHLDMSLNRLAGNIPSWLWTIGGTNSSLTHLNLSHNILSGFEEPLFDPLAHSLKIFDLHSNQLKGSFLLPPLLNSFVDYSNNYLSSEIPENISQYLNYTVFFSISNNSFSGKIPRQICESSHYLQVLDVSLNNLSGPVPRLAQIPKLRVLNLRGNKFWDTIPSNFATNCTLRTLNLNSNQLSGIVPVSLRNCEMLEVLDLGNNRLDGEFPGWLGNLSNLRVLVLRSNRFRGPVDAWNGSFEKLQIVDLSSNNFNGILSGKQFLNMKAMMIAEDNPFQPAVQFNYLQGLYYRDTVMITSKGLDITLVKILTIYTSIDVSNNSFVGSIPDGIGKLHALAFLNFSHNVFSGVIPRSIGNLKQLQSLDMSNNQLSGQIPRELVGLNFLAFLNLSYNNLSGVIPQGRQFNTFPNNSFLENPGLCGYPLENSCSNSTEPNKLSSMSCPAGEPKWLFIFVGFGLGGGLALAFGPLLSNKKWREVFNGHVDRLLLAIFPSCFWKWVSCGGDKVYTDGKVEEESDWVDEGHEHPFCIFCTGLEFISGQAMICHRECSCTRRDSR